MRGRSAFFPEPTRASRVIVGTVHELCIENADRRAIGPERVGPTTTKAPKSA